MKCSDCPMTSVALRAHLLTGPRATRMRFALLALAVFALHVDAVPAAVAAANERPIVMVVMDPLAAPLACACVEGFAQRDYRQLARFLEERLDRTGFVARMDQARAGFFEPRLPEPFLPEPMLPPRAPASP